MKHGTPHIVPLARQALTILRKIEPLSGHAKYLFQSLRTIERPMSNNTILAALRRMAYARDEMSGHGFRIMAERLLYQQEWPAHIIELQLARRVKNDRQASKNYAQYLPQRFQMMQAWANYLDSLKRDKSTI